VVFIVYLKLLKYTIEDNRALMTASYLLVRANYKTIRSVVCFDDSLILARCIIFSDANYMSVGICSSFRPKVVRMPY